MNYFIIKISIKDVHQSQPWPIVVDETGAIVSGRPDAEWIMNIDDVLKGVSFPVYRGTDGKMWEIPAGPADVMDVAPYTAGEGAIASLRATEQTYRRALSSVQFVDTVQQWFESEPVQVAVHGAKIAWESEVGMLETEPELVAAARALMEMVIAIAGLPVELDSITSRERVYRAILNGASSIEEWKDQQ